MKFAVVIPARYESSRFPGKPLIDIGGKTMIQRVYEQCLLVKSLSKIIVATDDDRIAQVVVKFGGNVCMTSNTHQSGTDRIQEVVSLLGLEEEVIINVQGDEPFIDPLQIEKLIACFEDKNAAIATLVKKVTDQETLHNPNTPKVILNNNQYAIYFSRAVIPSIRNVAKEDWLSKHDYFQHIGIYGYKREVLKEITQLSQSTLEIAESLEQLRWLENGYAIKTAITDIETIAIDTPDDLAKVLAKMNLAKG